METIDFSKITACGECCVGCKKKEDGLCEGCIESDGRCKEWAQSGECPIHRCAMNHVVQFCGLCVEFPCDDLPKKIHWNPNVVKHLTELAKAYYKEKNRTTEINEQNKNSWNRQASRYQAAADFSYNEVDYGDTDLPTEKELRLIGDVRGKRVLELGCGGANCGISLAKQGAIVTCADISKEQISFAKEKAKKENVDIQFVVSPMEKVVYNNEFDIVISMAAMMYVKDIESVFSNVSKSLKENGVFVFSLNDPIFYAVAAKYLWNDPTIQQSYFYSGEEKWKWENNDDFDFITYRRPIYEYINSLVTHNLSIAKFYQLKPEKEIQTTEDELEMLFPRMMVFKTVKKSI